MENWKVTIVDFDTQIKLAVCRYFAEQGGRPSMTEVVARTGSDAESVLAAYQRLGAQRLLVLELDGSSIRIASTFSGVPTQQIVEAGSSTFWYSTRSQENSRRPKPDEMREILAGLGLEGDFWDPTADRFG